MRIAVVGAGGVGGGCGAALAKAAADVTLIARGAHLAAMKEKGLRVESPRGDTHLLPTQATDDPRQVGPVDVVLFCVELWDVEKTLAFNRIAPPNLIPSMAVDLLRGNRIELHWLSGKVVELGKKHGCRRRHTPSCMRH
jgi:ketopantoate reductase